MHRRILLVRHGRPATRHPGAWIDLAGARRWRDSNDAACVADDDPPPEWLVQAAGRAHAVAASDLPRARTSAERLVRADRVQTSSLLREAVLDLPGWLPWKWPLGVWEAAIHAQWMLRMLRGSHPTPAELERAIRAVELLEEMSPAQGNLVVVTHGVFRRLLAQQLVERGWRKEPGRRSYACWSVWRLRQE